jgi:hypothetical protein
VRSDVIDTAVLGRLERIAALVDRELAMIEKELAAPDVPAPLGRLEMLAKLIRQLDLYDGRQVSDNPYAGLPADLLRQVLQHAGTKPTEP